MLIVFIGKLMWLPEVHRRALAGQKWKMFLVSIHVEVEFALLHGERLNEIYMVMKRRTRPVRWQTNFVELTRAAVVLFADKHSQSFARCIVSDDLILFHLTLQ
jgi:hypothetical protein